MKIEEIIEILKEANCSDVYECVFCLYDFDENHQIICKSTDPPIDPWNSKYCPFCKQIASLLERNVPQKAEYRNLPYDVHRFDCPRCKNKVEMFETGEQTNFCPHCGQAIIF